MPIILILSRQLKKKLIYVTIIICLCQILTDGSQATLTLEDSCRWTATTLSSVFSCWYKLPITNTITPKEIDMDMWEGAFLFGKRLIWDSQSQLLTHVKKLTGNMREGAFLFEKRPTRNSFLLGQDPPCLSREYLLITSLQFLIFLFFGDGLKSTWRKWVRMKNLNAPCDKHFVSNWWFCLFFIFSLMEFL